jgi:hypothetical protein
MLVCAAWVSVTSELLVAFVSYELCVLDHVSFENVLHMFVISRWFMFISQARLPRGPSFLSSFFVQSITLV